MISPKEWFIEKMMERAVKALSSNYFDARSFSDRELLINAVMQYATPGSKIGIGGSLSVRGIGLIERLSDQNTQVLDHWKQGLTKEEISAIRLSQLTCDLFLSSANAITEKGEIVNIDGFGNRINAMTFGPKKVIIIAGYNKIVPDVNSALDRIKRVAAPLNAKRLGLPLPCAETGYCHDCKTEARICKVTSIIQRRPSGTDVSVYLINEELGL
jgi:L-lactate utilization protein LutB